MNQLAHLVLELSKPVERKTVLDFLQQRLGCSGHKYDRGAPYDNLQIEIEVMLRGQEVAYEVLTTSRKEPTHIDYINITPKSDALNPELQAELIAELERLAA